jgi:hypothetical protein
VIDAERERDAMRTRVESFEKEHDELRNYRGDRARTNQVAQGSANPKGQRGKSEGERMHESKESRQGDSEAARERRAVASPDPETQLRVGTNADI